ncbi:hypothetical protein [Nitrososphaera viennensis]|uniref:Uncharacterized protein n=2 Tax=Nitrososphaera viennensis TaxID=1034015 RepID=A0A060HJ60_9ARCH|nr:hypothetical protein [Nitrososphaera viennensis]AIC15330.1 hypothetical protein NVIE_011010 [Nitrososphaera viennensis EN76]UVS70230.1 hypothetical protein NWT39_05440 [Nitrososphaera viennensis]
MMSIDNDGGRTLSLVLLVASAATIIISVVMLVLYGIYFFLFFLPITFGLPWSIKKLRKKQGP